MMVVVLHINLFGGVNRAARLSNDLVFRLSVNFYEEVCIIAVNVFVIISSWFLTVSKAEGIKSRRVLNLIVSMFFWYFIATSAALILGVRPNIKQVLISIPLVGCSYDFIAGYLILFLVSPFLNKLLNQLSKSTYKKLVIGVFSVFSLCSPVIINGYLSVNFGYSFAWFICIYLIVGYIRLNIEWKKWSWKKYLCVFLILTILGTLARSFVPILNVSKGYYNDPVIFLAALTCFLLFASIKIKGDTAKKIIVFCVPLSVAVFFIHANPFIEQWFKSIQFSDFIGGNTLKYLLVVPVLSLIVFVCCIVCDYLKKKLFEIMKINRLIDRISMFLDRQLIL